MAEDQRELLLLEPVLKENIWGGNRLVKEFHYLEKGDGIGECWGISAHPHGDCHVRDGKWQGKSLSWLYREHRELFGNLSDAEFPLLVKIIDARDQLSIQVHPDDVYAKLHENGSLGKTECWFVLDCPPHAELVIGHNARTREELTDLVREGRYEDLIRMVPVKKGDFIQIIPGTIHSITPGMLILETQQSSDITYRIYDYGRLVNGKPREMHVEKAIEVTNVPDFTAQMGMRHCANPKPNVLTELVSCKYYCVWRLDVKGRFDMEQSRPFLLVSIIDGEGSIDGKSVKKGDHMIIPCGYGNFSFEGNIGMMLSSVNC